MSNKDLLDNIKKLREMTGVGFKDCKIALDESKGDLEKSVEFLRKKGIAKASKKMNRTAAEGLALVKEQSGEIALIEINSETDFVAKNQDFICDELNNCGAIKYLGRKRDINANRIFKEIEYLRNKKILNKMSKSAKKVIKESKICNLISLV